MNLNDLKKVSIFSAKTIVPIVGIGTTIPQSKLDVSGSIRGDKLLLKDNLTSISSIYTELMLPVASDRSALAVVDGTAQSVGNNETVLLLADGQSNDDDGFSIMAWNSGGFARNVLRARANGNVGIGTTTPGNSLHVYGSSTVPANLDTSAPNSYLKFATSGVSRGFIGYAASGSAGIAHVNSAGTTVNMLVTDSGNVGVGTTAPGAKLDVAGEVKFGNTASACNVSNEGQQRYNSTLKIMEYCDATTWRSIAPQMTTITATIYPNNNETTWTYSSYVSCPANYTLQFYGMRGNNNGTSSVYSYCDCSSSGNSIRAGAFGLSNVNYTCTCSGLCTK